MSIKDLENGKRIYGFKPKYLFNQFEIFYYYLQNDSFKKLVDSGRYVYSNGFLILNDAKPKKEINIDDEIFLKENCLSRTITRKPYSVVHRFAPKSNNRKENRKGVVVTYSVLGRSNTRLIPVFKHAENHIKLADINETALNEYIQNLGRPEENSFGRCLKVYLKREGVSQAKLSELINVSVNTISRICNDRYRPPIKTAVAICIALHLLPYESKDMLDLAGHSLDGAYPELAAYKLLLNLFYLESLEECNRFLTEHNFEPLT